MAARAERLTMLLRIAANHRSLAPYLMCLAWFVCSAQMGCREGASVDVPGGDPSSRHAREAPMLAERVAAGDLPPLEERLPEDPLVAIPPAEGPGIYGGTWRRCHMAPDTPALKMVLLYTPLVRWRSDCQGMAPGIAQSWERNADATEWTFHLRRGMKWSDGAPYTSEDFMFWWELCLDDRHFYTPPYWAYSGGKRMDVEAPDAYTLVFRFAEPNHFIDLNLASGFWWNEQYNIPKHTMKQFHPDYNSEYSDFVEFNERNIVHTAVGRPTLGPWFLAAVDAASTRIVYERNPYYWVVDQEGRQLPYIDRVESTYCQTTETMLLKAMAGEIDCQFRMLEVDDAALLLQFAEKGGYHVERWESAAGADRAVLINWSHKDLRMRTLLRDKRFRRALSYAMDRERIQQVAWHGLGIPQAGTVSEQAWHFQSPEGKTVFREWAEAYADHQPDLANAYLDELGFTERNAQGRRLWPQGDVLRLVLDSADTGRENDTAVLLKQDWEAVGIDVVIYTPPLSARTNRHRFGDFDVSLSGCSEMDLFTYPDWVFPTRAQYWHPAVGLWYETGGREGEAPTGPVKELVDLYDACKREPDLEARHRLIHRAIRVHIDEGPFYLGTVAQLPQVVLVSNRFRNVPDTGILGPWAIGQPGSLFPEQFYLDAEADQ